MLPIIILEMANNHCGDVNHGMKIIETYAEICKKYKKQFQFVFKFQYRDLETFIRKDMKGDFTIPLIKRFSETKLSKIEFKELIDFCKIKNMGTMVTPFDEKSVDTLIEHEVDFIKIASCSFGDWPLLEKIATCKKKVIASCAGAKEEIIEQVVSFFMNRDIYLLLQHCVGEYPTPYENLNVAQVAYLRNKFSNIDIGFSSHEDPSSVDIAPLALALGAKSFEKHVAIETENIKKNKYSTSPDEFESWIYQLSKSIKIMGESYLRYSPTENESNSLRKLQRGVFAKINLNKGDVITHNDIYFAFPPSEDQLTANNFSKYCKFTLKEKLSKDEPIFLKQIYVENSRKKILDIATKVVSLLKKSKITFPKFADLEISHHYGIDNFYKYGLTMITVVNREYCKKILILLPGQSHPEQFHKRKEETFHVLWGDGNIRLNDVERKMNIGDVIVVEPETRHFFSSHNGIVIEEISSTHNMDDSFYTDQKIHENKNRKTLLTHWRMFE